MHHGARALAEGLVMGDEFMMLKGLRWWSSMMVKDGSMVNDGHILIALLMLPEDSIKLPLFGRDLANRSGCLNRIRN